MLWVDKYRPHSFDKFVSSGDFPHTLFYGPPGAGKKTLVMALLREIYGAGVEKIKVETRPWQIELPSRKIELEMRTISSNYKVKLPSRKIELEMMTISSNYHVEMNPSDVGNNDRYVVQEIIKEMAKNRPIDATGTKGFKVLVLNEVDRLSKEAQQALRRTMEKYSSACRLIMCCNNISKVMDPVRSRCMCIRVAAPTEQEVMDVLGHVSKKEQLNLPDILSARIASMSNRNMRRALLSLEVTKAQKYPFTEDQLVQAADWELYIQEIAGDILVEQSPKRLQQVRAKMYELLANCIPAELILRQMLFEMLKKLDQELKQEAVFWAAFYESRLQSGQKQIFHLEAFVAKFMSLYKSWTISSFG
eukprot:gene24957-10615_t